MLAITTAAVAAALLLGACERETKQVAAVRPVRTATVTHVGAGETVTLIGQVQAQTNLNLAFRIAGRLLKRNADVGDAVSAGQVVASLETQDALHSVQTAEANVAAVRSTLALAQVTFDRQSELLTKGFAAKAKYDEAAQQLQSARSQLEASQAQLKQAQDNLGYTELHTDVGGAVTAKGAEPGEVVQAGQMVLQLAQQGGRDAVFNVPAQIIRQSPRDIRIEVALSDDPRIRAEGRVREVAPLADQTTRTYVVKVGLIDPPPAMRLGATVRGSVVLDAHAIVKLPASALMQSSGKPAVWIVNPTSLTVDLRAIEIARYEPNDIVVADGVLKDGDLVVTAGVQALHPGQTVRLLDKQEARP
jgi:RND family efflux transporter MFP subunit